MEPPADLIFALQTILRFHILCVALRTEAECVGDARGHTRDTEADRGHIVTFNHENFQLIALNEGALSVCIEGALSALSVPLV